MQHLLLLPGLVAQTLVVVEVALEWVKAEMDIGVQQAAPVLSSSNTPVVLQQALQSSQDHPHGLPQQV